MPARKHLSLNPALRSSLRTQRDGTVLRRITVYLPVELAKEFMVHCVRTDEDMSRVATRLVAKLLQQQQAKTK